MSKIFEFVKYDDEKAILKVKDVDNLTIAEYPYINKNMDYITITRGQDHTMTVVTKDGGTWSVDWGYSGCTLCSTNTNKLKRAAYNFFNDECKISMGRY